MKSEASNPKKVSSKKKLTPRELLNKRIENPDYHITNEDMKNQKIGADAEENIEEEEKEKFDELKNETGKKPPNPYDILSS